MKYELNVSIPFHVGNTVEGIPGKAPGAFGEGCYTGVIQREFAMSAREAAAYSRMGFNKKPGDVYYLVDEDGRPYFCFPEDLVLKV